MAFYDDEDEQNQSGQAAAAPADSPTTPNTTSAQSGTLDAGSAGTASTSAASSAAASANAQGKDAPAKPAFFNISQYIDANKPQSQKLAGQVAGSVDAKAQGVDDALNSATNSFNQTAQAQQINQNSDLLNQVQNNAAAVTADPDQTSSFNQMRDATYTGPTSLDDTQSGGTAWSGIQNALTAAQQIKADAGTESGRMGLIKSLDANAPHVTQGALNFDNLLLQSNPDAAGQLANAGSSLATANDRINAANTAAQTQATNIAANNAATAKAAQDAVATGYQNLGSDLGSREAALQAQQDALYQQIKTGLGGSGQLTSAQLQSLGLAPNTETFNLNLGDYLDKGADVDVNSAANADDLAKQSALQSLAAQGQDLGGLILNPAEGLGQVGQAYNFRANDLSSAQSKAQNDFSSQDVSLQNTIDNMLKAGKMNSWAGGLSAADLQKLYAVEAQQSALAQQYGIGKKLGVSS